MSYSKLFSILLSILSFTHILSSQNEPLWHIGETTVWDLLRETSPSFEKKNYIDLRLWERCFSRNYHLVFFKILKKNKKKVYPRIYCLDLRSKKLTKADDDFRKPVEKWKVKKGKKIVSVDAIKVLKEESQNCKRGREYKETKENDCEFSTDDEDEYFEEEEGFDEDEADYSEEENSEEPDLIPPENIQKNTENLSENSEVSATEEALKFEDEVKKYTLYFIQNTLLSDAIVVATSAMLFLHVVKAYVRAKRHSKKSILYFPVFILKYPFSCWKRPSKHKFTIFIELIILSTIFYKFLIEKNTNWTTKPTLNNFFNYLNKEMF
ncbi:hypothetical protein ACFLY6_01775 [Candidatus Dependentiae bacterium]